MKLQPGGSVWSQISNPRQTYTDGYGVERPVNESKAITIGRKVYNAVDKFLNGPSEEWYEERGMSKPNASLGIAGWVTPSNAVKFASYINTKEVSDLMNAGKKYWNALNVNEKSVFRNFAEAIGNPWHYNESKMMRTKYNEAIQYMKNVIGRIETKIKSVEQLANSIPKQAGTLKPVSTQKTITSDFEPFDEMKTLWETGSKAKTTEQFRLSDWKYGGKLL